MPKYTFQVAGFGTVTADADTEACARYQVGPALGLDPDRLDLVSKDPGAPVIEGDPRQPDSLDLLDLDDEEDDRPCDCSDCRPDLVRVPWWGAAALALAALLIVRRG